MTTDVIDHIETDVRERILVTAERLFREIGYQKTAVADIRYSDDALFPSSINRRICK